MRIPSRRDCCSQQCEDCESLSEYFISLPPELTVREKKRAVKASKYYGLRSSDALPLSTSKGTELCSCVIIQLPSSLWKQIVVRHHMSSCAPSVLVALIWLRPWENARVSATVIPSGRDVHESCVELSRTACASVT